MRRKLWITSVILAITLVGVWWVWQAPYRTLTAFVNALYAGDIKTIYELTPVHEREQTGVKLNMELVERTYRQFLKPLLDQHYPREKLVRIQRESSKNVGSRRQALFYLWFRDELYPLVIYLCHPPDRQGWRVPFSYFVWLTAKGLYGNPTPIMHQLGYEKVATADGGTFWLQ